MKIPRPGVEPGRPKAQDFESSASANSAIWAHGDDLWSCFCRMQALVHQNIKTAEAEAILGIRKNSIRMGRVKGVRVRKMKKI